MSKSIDVADRRVILFGQQNLQNSILIGFIHQRTRVDCQLVSVPEWRGEWTGNAGQTLALIDADSARTDRIQELLEQVHDQEADISVAFFNTSRNHPVKRTIVRPMDNGFS